MNLTANGPFSAIFVYATGNAMTLPIARYFLEGNVVDEYGTTKCIPDAALRQDGYFSHLYTGKQQKI